METQTLKIVALPTSIVETVRATMRDPQYEYPAFESLANGYGPCRHCLREFKVGVDRRILFTYDPFAQLETLPLPGPIFVHSLPCERYREDGGFPSELRSHALTLNAYARGRKLLAQKYVSERDIDRTMDELLAQPDVSYIHLRDTEAGCYDFRVDRTVFG